MTNYDDDLEPYELDDPDRYRDMLIERELED